MKIGYICSEYPALCEEFGGIGTVTRTLAHELARCGCDTIIYAVSDRALSIADGPVRVISVERDGVIQTIRTLRSRIRADLQTGVVDVVEAPECESHVLPGGLGSVVRMHGSHHFWCRTLEQRVRPARLLLEQFGIRRAAGLCAVSSFAADETRVAMGLGEREIEVIYSPVNTDFFAPIDDPVCSNRIVFVGSVVEKKGIRELCRAMQHVVKQHPKASLVVVGRDCPSTSGRGTFREEIVGELGSAARECISFIGPAPTNTVRDFMASAAICAFPSYMETQGMVICEAMACGRPVITSRNGPGQEVIGVDGECGWTVDPKDPDDIARRLCSLLASPDLRTDMGKKGRQRAVDHFSIDVSVKKNKAFYHRHAVSRVES